MLRTLCIAVAVLASTAAVAQDAPSGSAERGRRLFAEFTCNSCHGNLGQGGDLGAGPKIYPNPFPFVAFKAQVRKPRLTMPGLWREVDEGPGHRPISTPILTRSSRRRRPKTFRCCATEFFFNPMKCQSKTKTLLHRRRLQENRRRCEAHALANKWR